MKKTILIISILLASHIAVGYYASLYGAKRGFDIGAQAVYDYMISHGCKTGD